MNLNSTSFAFGVSVATFVLVCCSLFVLILSSGCGGQDTDNDASGDTGFTDTGVSPDSDFTDTDGSDPCQVCRKEGLICPEEMKNSNKNSSALSRQDCVDPNAPGTLKVTGNTTADRPSIFIDGSDTGKTLPAEFEKEPGEYEVALKADGYLMYERKPQQVKVKPEQKTEVTISLYRDASGKWQDQDDPDRKFNVKMHFDSFRNTSEECEDDVYLKNLDGHDASYCLHPDNTFTLCSREKPEPCQGYWAKGEFLNPNEIRLTTCNTNNGCFEPRIYKKISE